MVLLQGLTLHLGPEFQVIRSQYCISKVRIWIKAVKNSLVWLYAGRRHLARVSGGQQ